MCRGNGASVARIIPYAALHFSTYEHYRAALVQALHSPSADSSAKGHHTSDKRPPVWIDLLAGSCSGATAVVATYPLDLVRTRLAWEVEGHNKLKTTGIIRTLQHILRQEGVVGLYRVRCPPEPAPQHRLHTRIAGCICTKPLTQRSAGRHC